MGGWTRQEKIDIIVDEGRRVHGLGSPIHDALREWRMLRDDPKIQCGYGKLSLPTDSVFTKACEWHDSAFLEGSRHQQLYSRALIDKTLHNQFLLIAGENKFLRAQAHIMYGLTRAFGWLFWEGKR